MKEFLNGVGVVSELFFFFSYLYEHDDDVIDIENGMDVAYLETIYVEKEYRGQGIGTALLKNGLEKCQLPTAFRRLVVYFPHSLSRMSRAQLTILEHRLRISSSQSPVHMHLNSLLFIGSKSSSMISSSSTS